MQLLQMDWLTRWITAANILLLYWNWNWVEGALSGYNETPTQYHIQTDDGPERFFRFQTYNGQYRKERRLDDGTVLGSYGWVDPAGFLRMTDYIADAKGYRILKSRMEYVGVKAMPEIEVKKYRPMKHSRRVETRNPVFLNALESVIIPQVSNETRKPPVKLNVAPTTFSPKLYETVKPLPKLFAAPTPITIKRLYFTTTPPQRHTTPTTPEPSIQLNETPTPKIFTVSPINQLKENSGFLEPNLPNGSFIVYARKPSSQNIFRVAESRPEVASVLPVSRFGRIRPSLVVQNTHVPESNGDVFKNYTTPLRRAVAGFMYKIPNQYHKDETEVDGSRTGSFGYVDPFGIRRVIHYNAGRNGFEHSKDFKYVGKQDES